jgi:Trk-type K+ transport system membrane component
MNAVAILRSVALGAGVVGASALVPFALAWRWQGLEASLPFLACVFAGVFVFALVRVMVPRSSRPASARDLLVAMTGWWLISPLVAAPAFMASAVGLDLGGAYLEALSCLTTTGATLTQSESGAGTAARLPGAWVAWRGMLHVFGALGSLAAALTVLPALNFGGVGMHRSRLFTGTAEGFVPAFVRTLGVSAMVFGVLFLAVNIAYAMSGLAPARALSLSVSALTTGLVDPVADRMSAAGDGPRFVTLMALYLSAMSLPTLLAVRAWPKRLIADTEALALAGVILVAGGIASWLAGLSFGLEGLVWAASHVATSGVMTEPLSRGMGEDAAQLAIILTLVGGSALSTAGGVKMARVMVLAQRSRLEFVRLAHENRVAPFVYRGRAREDVVVTGVWVYLVSYVLAIAGLLLVLGLGERDLPEALRFAVGVFSNAGHMVDLGSLRGLEAVAVAFGMIAGRLEVLAALALLRPGFWRV